MPRQEKNASEKRKQVEKGGSHPCMRASVCVNVARTPYRGLLLLLLSPPFFLPFFSLLYLLCAPLYAPLLALRSRVRARKLLPACSTLLLRFLLLLLLLPPLCFVLAFLSIRVTSPLPQIRFLSKIVSSSMAPLFSLRKFPRRFLWFLQSRFFSTHLSSPPFFFQFARSSSSSSRSRCRFPSSLLLLLHLRLFVPVISSSSCPCIPDPHMPLAVK